MVQSAANLDGSRRDKRARQGMDAGYPPIRLPFQELATGNHIAQWVEVVDRAPCRSDRYVRLRPTASAAPTDTASRSSINPRGLCSALEIRHPSAVAASAVCSLFALGAVLAFWRFCQVLQSDMTGDYWKR